MYRSILFNCWIALIAFTLYFVSTIYLTGGAAAPSKTIAMSFLWAAIGFVFAYMLRAFFNYILYTPEQIEVAMENENRQNVLKEYADDATSGSLRNNSTSTVEFQDETSEDIAQVVRTMLNRDEVITEK
jgi:hypothetical protein